MVSRNAKNMALTATLAILIVQTICSFAVIGYFRNNHPESRHWFATLTAPLVGGAGMIAVIVLLLMNFGTAAGDASDTLYFRLIPYLIGGVFLSGVALALYLRARSPEKYARIGRIVAEDAAERAEEDEGGAEPAR